MSYQLPPKYQRYADRLKELIQEGEKIIEVRSEIKDTKDSEAPFFPERHLPSLQAWVAKSENILTNLCPVNSSYHKQYDTIRQREEEWISNEKRRKLLGILQAALDDLEKGFLLDHTFLVATDVFDSVLEQAQTLLDAGYKDPAAMLCRVVIEDGLKRLARARGISDVDKKKSSKLNFQLKQEKEYNKSQWRQITTWLDYGNEAAHGNFENYSEDEVQKMINGIEGFLATYLSI